MFAAFTREPFVRQQIGPDVWKMRKLGAPFLAAGGGQETVAASDAEEGCRRGRVMRNCAHTGTADLREPESAIERLLDSNVRAPTRPRSR